MLQTKDNARPAVVRSPKSPYLKAPNIKNSRIMEVSSTSLRDLIDHYESILSGLLDVHAPVREKTKTVRTNSPWFTPEIREQKIIRRRLERRCYTKNCTLNNVSL